MKPHKYLMTFLFSFLTLMAFAQEATSCKLLKHGRFKYLDAEDTSAYIITSDTVHIEYHNNGKYYIKSKLTWVNDCEYIMTMTAITIPNFPFHVGDKMKVEITKIKEGIIYYNSTVGNQKWPGRLRIIYLDKR